MTADDEVTSRPDTVDVPEVAPDREPETAAVPSRVEGAVPRRDFAQLEELLGYHFNDKLYLANALVHKSYLHAVPDLPYGSNERLEFLGDSILGFIVSSDLYLAYPDTDEGQLTAWRGALVRLTTLAQVAEPLDLGEYMFMSRGEEVSVAACAAPTWAELSRPSWGPSTWTGAWKPLVRSGTPSSAKAK